MYSALYSFSELKKICYDNRVDHHTRNIAYGLHKTNPKAAQEYVIGYPRRNYIMKQPINKVYND